MEAELSDISVVSMHKAPRSTLRITKLGTVVYYHNPNFSERLT